MTTYDIIVIGGGIAGCSATIELARLGYRVLLLEQQRYPTHKLCGEFLSVEVIAAFEKLGVLDTVRNLGACPINRAYITTSTGASFSSKLPGVALGLSRYRLDFTLFRRAQELGAICNDSVVVHNVSGDLKQGFVVTTNRGDFESSVVLGAYGKSSSLDRKIRPFLQKTPFVAFKAHYKGIDLSETIEMHAFPGGYCGLSPIEEKLINVCWIAHEHTLRAAGGNVERMIAGSLKQNAVLAKRFESIQRVSQSFQALSQITFAIKGKFDQDICMIGDTAGMIAPLCGDGMAMALRSAELAVPLVSSFLKDYLTIEAFKRQYISAWNAEFKNRLFLGRLMHYSYIYPAIASTAVTTCQLFPSLGNWLIRETRGNSGSSSFEHLQNSYDK